jgi:hypothetical protein
VKEFLREDFCGHCAYCGDSDFFYGLGKGFHIDHFAPKSLFGTSATNKYSNYVYSCPSCNVAKSNTWIGKTIQENIVGDEGFADPCSSDYEKYLYRDSHGSIHAVTKIGDYMVNNLKLFLPTHQAFYELEEIEILLKRMSSDYVSGLIPVSCEMKFLEAENTLILFMWNIIDYLSKRQS